jgi:hypothetical protein
MEMHDIALKLEPDGADFSCAEARMALVNTAMIAYANGKISEEPEDQPPDEQDGGDAPPF